MRMQFYFIIPLNHVLMKMIIWQQFLMVKKETSREFLAYFAQFLQESADQGLDDLMDFLADEAAEKFSVNWDKEAFENGIADLSETDFYKYPRY